MLNYFQKPLTINKFLRRSQHFDFFGKKSRDNFKVLKNNHILKSSYQKNIICNEQIYGLILSIDIH